MNSTFKMYVYIMWDFEKKFYNNFETWKRYCHITQYNKINNTSAHPTESVSETFVLQCLNII